MAALRAKPEARGNPGPPSLWTRANTSGEASPGAAEAGMRPNSELGSAEAQVRLLRGVEEKEPGGSTQTKGDPKRGLRKGTGEG